MKKGIERNADEPISQWLVRIAKTLNLNEELTFLMFEVSHEVYIEGIKVGKKFTEILNNT